MKKTLLFLLFTCLTCSVHALTLRVEQIQASDFSVMVKTIGKIVINGTTLEFYDRQGALLHSADMTTIGALTFEESTVPIDNVFVSDKYVVYPNPTSTSLIVKGLNETAILRLYSMDGQLITTAVGPTMNVEQVPAGNYLLQCENQIVKIIKQ